MPPAGSTRRRCTAQPASSWRPLGLCCAGTAEPAVPRPRNRSFSRPAPGSSPAGAPREIVEYGTGFTALQDPGAAAGPSIGGEAGIGVLDPGEDAPGQVPEPGEALLAEQRDRLGAAHPALAVDDHRH